MPQTTCPILSLPKFTLVPERAGAVARRGSALLLSRRHSKKNRNENTDTKHNGKTTHGKSGGRESVDCLLDGARNVFLRVVVQVLVRENVVPARHLGNYRPRRDLVQPEIVVHLKEVATGNATTGEAVLSKNTHVNRKARNEEQTLRKGTVESIARTGARKKNNQENTKAEVSYRRQSCYILLAETEENTRLHPRKLGDDFFTTDYGVIARVPARHHPTAFRSPANRDVSPLVLVLDLAEVSIGARFLQPGESMYQRAHPVGGREG